MDCPDDPPHILIWGIPQTQTHYLRKKMTQRFKPEQKFRSEQRLTWKVTATLIGVVDREPEWNDQLGSYIYDLRYLGIQDKTNPLKMRITTLVSQLERDLTLLNP